MNSDELNERLIRIEAWVASLELTLATVERTQKVVLTEVRGLASKVDRLTVATTPAHRRF
jgi:hypothetical protein